MDLQENKVFTMELNEFRFLFNNFTVGLKDLKDMEENIRVIDILSPYRLKTLDKTAPLRANKALITNFSVVKAKRTDAFFVTFALSRKALDFVLRYFRGADRSYRKYKVEFSKAERSLLWKLKNNEPLVFNHKDWTDDEFETFENPIQNLPNEWDYKMAVKEENRRSFLIRREIRKYRREFKTLPKVEEPKRPKTESLKSVEVKQGGVVFNGLGEVKRVEEVIKPPIKPQKSVVISTEKIKEEKKEALW